MSYNSKELEWDELKNQWLIEHRGISFEEIALAIEMGFLLDMLPHFNQAKYPGQEVYYVLIRGYVYLVPFVRNRGRKFLKTIVPSRKYTKKYLLDNSNGIRQ